jgi:hypothetical protein
MKKFLLKTIVAAAMTGVCVIAVAAPPAPLLPSPGVCSPNFSQGGQSPTFGDLSGVTVTQCAGFFQGNDINSGNATSLTLINSVITSASWGSLAALTGTPTNWLAKYDTENTTINFGRTLYGDTIVGFHWGNIAGAAQNVSALYRFDAGSTGISSFTVLGGGLSNAALYMTVSAVPETETYAMMLAGLGLMGTIARRRKNKNA